MRRREVITLIGSAAAWPLAARAQQGGRMRQVGLIRSGDDSDAQEEPVIAAFRQELAKLGWIEGRNLHIELRYSAVDFDRMRANVQELVALSPDVIVVGGGAATLGLQQRTGTVPIVFVLGGDPVASGVVQRIARPEANTTGITNLFPSIAGKWLELLKQAVPNVERVGLIFHPEFPVAGNYLASIEAAASIISLKSIRTPVRD